MQLFTSNVVNLWTGMVLFICGLLWCFFQLFGLSFWRHPFTAEHPLVSKWCNAKFLQICSDNKQIYFLNGLRISTFSANFHFWVNYSFNVNLKLYFYHHRDPYVVALRSVTVATVPPDENSIRSDVKCAGFLVHEIGYSACKVPTIPSESE